MTPRWKKSALALAALALLGALVSASGLLSIRASGGHLSVVQAALKFSMRRSVATHAAGTDVPALDDPALVLKGAGHYEIGCRACHGSPSVPTSRLARAMLPVPPYLPRTVGGWSDAELFEVVKHGIKFTGMPAWPSQRRDDEVWAMVAFLRALPAMRPAEYRRLVGSNIARAEGAPTGPIGVQRPPEVADNCGPCHGLTGEGRGSSAFPSLAGQSERYLLASLEAFARGARHSGVMQPVASELDDAQRRALARHYAALRPTPPRPVAPPDATSLARGERIARRGLPSSRVPACAPCHGPGGAPRNPMYPTLAGQYADHLALQLTLFQRGERGGAAYARVMQRAAQGLTGEARWPRGCARWTGPPPPSAPLRQHLVGLVDDLLDVSRITEGKVQLKRERVELADVAARAIEMASPLLEQNRHDLRVDVPRRGLAVDGDPGRLAQVLSNLNADAAEMLSESLAFSGYVTQVAYDGPSALLAAERFDPDFAVLDIGLPVMDGFELARRFADHPRLRRACLVALTGYGQEQDRQRSAAVGFRAHLVKPVDLDQLHAVIKRLHGDGPDAAA